MSLGPVIISKGKNSTEKQLGSPQRPMGGIRFIDYSIMSGMISYYSTNKSHLAEPPYIHLSPATS